MSDHTSLTAAAPTGSARAARQERRQAKRAGISLRVRLRNAEFDEYKLEDVRPTLNASRKAIYFVTREDRYYKGMRLRVTFPYDPKAGEANLEQVGEVVRVQRRDGGYGVAVAMLPAAPPNIAGEKPRPDASTEAVTSTPKSGGPPSIERRAATRLAFIAQAEVVDMHEGSRVKARTSDLSMQGCYIDTLNPFPIGAAVRVQVERNEQVLDMLGTVTSHHLGSGMGLVFADMTSAQREVLKHWLQKSRPPVRTAFGGTVPPSLQPRYSADQDATRVVRLIHALVHKGLLSQSEANEILSDPNA
jgi:hypothetical protein